MCLEAGFAENDFVNATKKILRTRTQPRTFPQGPGAGPEPGPEYQGPGQGQGLESLQGPRPGPGQDNNSGNWN